MRCQLPARSPLPARALVAGFRGALMGGDADRAWLRSRLLERYGALDVLLTDSGTTALRLALAGAGSPPAQAYSGVPPARAPSDAPPPRAGGGSPAAPAADRPRVALPAYSCYDLATAAVGADVRVRLYDLEPASLAPEPASLDRALDAGTHAAVVAPLYGVPVELEGIEAMCAERNALLIEDAAQGIGAAYRGAPLGANGSLAVLSFAGGKGWTGGGGGALLAHDERGVEALRSVLRGPAADGAIPDRETESRSRPPKGPGGSGDRRGWATLSRTVAQWTLGRPSLYGLPRRLPFLHLGETVYREPWPPGGLSGTAAAALRASEAAADQENWCRRANADRLLRAIRKTNRLQPVMPPSGSEPGWLRLPVLLPEGTGQTEIPDRLGVYRGYPTPLHALEAIRPHLASGADPTTAARAFSGAEVLADRLVTLPTHGALRARDFEALEAWIHDIATY